MDRTILVEEDTLITPIEVDIKGGLRLLKALVKVEFDLRVALWLYSSDFGEWRLVLGSPLVDQEGPKSAYTIVQSELAKMKPQSRILLRNISVVGLDDDPVHALLARNYQGWFRQLVIGGVFVEAAYIYDLKKPGNDKTGR